MVRSIHQNKHVPGSNLLATQMNLFRLGLKGYTWWGVDRWVIVWSLGQCGITLFHIFTVGCIWIQYNSKNLLYFHIKVIKSSFTTQIISKMLPSLNNLFKEYDYLTQDYVVLVLPMQWRSRLGIDLPFGILSIRHTSFFKLMLENRSFSCYLPKMVETWKQRWWKIMIVGPI